MSTEVKIPFAIGAAEGDVWGDDGVLRLMSGRNSGTQGRKAPRVRVAALQPLGRGLPVDVKHYNQSSKRQRNLDAKGFQKSEHHLTSFHQGVLASPKDKLTPFETVKS